MLILNWLTVEKYTEEDIYINKYSIFFYVFIFAILRWYFCSSLLFSLSLLKLLVSKLIKFLLKKKKIADSYVIL